MSINQFPNCAALGPTLTPGIADLWEQPTTIHTADSCTLSRLGLWHRSWLKPMVYKDGIQECHVQGSGLEEEEVLPGPGECRPQMRLTISECTEHNNQLPNSLRWTEISCSTGWAKKSWGQTVLPQPFSPNTLLDDWSLHTFPSLAVPVFCVCMKSFLLSFKVGSWALFRPVELRISLTNINYTLPSLQEFKVFQKFKNHRSEVLKIVTGRLSERQVLLVYL